MGATLKRERTPTDHERTKSLRDRLDPTEIGDVLILRSSHSYTIYAVGAVTFSGQRDFSGSRTVTHIPDHAGALRAAKCLAAPGRRIYFLDIDTEEWSEITE